MTADNHRVSPDFLRSRILDDLKSGTVAQVVTRFPPEPNGFLHIGHAKSIGVNFGIAAQFGGSCHLRFDDTNPETEESRFFDAIVDDLRWLGYEPASITYTSDQFGTLFEWAKGLIERGAAYVDDSPAEVISAERGGYGSAGTESLFRTRSVAENLRLFEAMRSGGFGDGQKVLRAKIDMQADNLILRDPVLYRIRHREHPRTGDKWVIYPTYDWAHGQVDALEGVTHSIATLEFENHRPLYDWLLERLDLPGVKPQQMEFARLELTHTVTSKRKLRGLVEDGTVDGWDDPRLPTLQGMRRRGYPPQAIRAFLGHVGVSRANSVIDIELFESFVRTEHNANAQRRMAVLDPIKLVITNWPAGETVDVEIANNPEDDEAGVRMVPFTGRVWIERDDFRLDPPSKFYRLSPGREVRLRNAFYVTATDAVLDSAGNVVEVQCTYDPQSVGGSTADGRKVKATLHWVSESTAVQRTVHLYDRLFLAAPAGSTEPVLNPDSLGSVQAWCEPAIGDIAPGEVVQFERLGYFADDPKQTNTFHRTVGLRDEWARIQKRSPTKH